jgi:uncharacterized protein YegL
MLSTRLTAINNGILSSHEDLMNMIQGARPLVERRTRDNKIFGKLEITTPDVRSLSGIEIDTTTTTHHRQRVVEPRNLIAGFLLDTSGSMEGVKLRLAINTIKKFIEVLHAERDGKTIQHQPFHTWIYVITFNSVAELVIPYQEITAESMRLINERLDYISATGCTNYEKAFAKQAEVIEDILMKITTPQQYHLIRFFETDGEITEGSTKVNLLYDMMRCTKTTTETETDTETETETTASTTSVSSGGGPRITFEDYVIGYGKGVDLGYLKVLASPYHPEGTAVVEGRTPPRCCTSLVTILNTEDIGFKAGEILFKLIMRCGNNWEISVETSNGGATVELFEYQTNQWGAETTIHSMIHGEKRPLWIQYTPPPHHQSTELNHYSIRVTIKYENQFTGEKFTYKFEHEIASEQQGDDAASPPPPPSTTLCERITTVVPMINGMAQLEIFKMFREIEADRYDKDTIVREAYKIMRMLKSIITLTSISYPAIACHTQNLITDVKVIIGLTTLHDEREQKMVIHDRRICSAEQEIFNSCATISRKYINDEENYEEEAIRVINAAKAANPDHDDDDGHGQEEYYEEFDDALPSRIATVPPPMTDYMDTPYVGGTYSSSSSSSSSISNNTSEYRPRRRASYGSELRALCVRIAVARNKKEQTTAEELYQQMKTEQFGGMYYMEEEDYIPVGDQDDTFSNTPIDDVYSQCRIGIMRQVSSS